MVREIEAGERNLRKIGLAAPRAGIARKTSLGVLPESSAIWIRRSAAATAQVNRIRSHLLGRSTWDERAAQNTTGKAFRKAESMSGSKLHNFACQTSYSAIFCGRSSA
jgi:hypothetical protein